MKQTQLSIIIVSWNVKEYLLRLLESLGQYLAELSLEIIVVDNASLDGTVAALEKRFSSWLHDGKLRIIANDENAGFSRANNQGWEIANGEYLLFMNPDMEIFDDRLRLLMDFLEQNKNVGAATCRLLYPDNTVQPNVKSDPALCSQILVLLKVHHWLAFLPCLKKYLRKDFNYLQKAYIEQAMGALLMLPRAFMEIVGGWDEQYWLWFEDVALCTRIRELGRDIVFLPDAEVIHYESRSFAQWVGLKKQRRFNRGLLTYFGQYRPRWQYLILYMFIPLNLLLTSIVSVLHIKPRPQSRI